MVRKIRVFKSFMVAYRELYSRRVDIFAIAWFPLFLILLLPLPFYLHEELYSSAASYLGYFEYLGIALEAIVSSIFFVAVFRLIILDEKPSFRSIALKRGIENAKVFNIKFYFQLKKREVLYAAASIVFAFILMGAEDLYRQVKMNQLIEDRISDFSLLPWYDSIFYFPYISMAAWYLLGSLTFFIWPYLSINNEVSFSEVRTLVRSVWGNILRLIFVLFLLSLPYEFLRFLSMNYVYHIYDFLPDELGFIGPYFTRAFFTVLDTICALAVVVLAGLLWKDFRQKSATGSPAPHG